MLNYLNIDRYFRQIAKRTEMWKHHIMTEVCNEPLGLDLYIYKYQMISLMITQDLQAFVMRKNKNSSNRLTNTDSLRNLSPSFIAF